MARQASGSRWTRWLDAPEWPGPQRGDRFRAGYGEQASRKIIRRRAGFCLVGLIEKLTYGTQLLDIAPAVSAIDKVVQQAFSIGIVQRPVDKR